MSGALDTERADARSPYCWILAGFSSCKRKGKVWVRWNHTYPSILACRQHSKHPSWPDGGGDRPSAPPLELNDA